MRAILKIAKTELQMLFYSPIAWLLLLCFVIQTAIYFTGAFQDFMIAMDKYGGTYWVSDRTFVIGRGGNARGLWYQVASFLYLYIPLLTMGVISKELSSGSIKLLYSSPISNVHIILGKFLAMVIYAVALMTILLIYVIFAWCTVKDFEIAWILTGLLGLFLQTCTYMAVGIFVSSLTSYQVISAVGTFIVLMLLSMVSGFGQQYDFVREITYWLGINGRASTFIQGMICSEDLIYFPVVIAMFLALTIIRLNAVRQKQKFSITVGKNAVVVALVCVIAFFSSRPALIGYVDTTTTKKNTLTPVSQEIIAQMKGGMSITTYVNVLSPSYISYSYPRFIMENRNQFKLYTRFKPEIDLKVVYYYADTRNNRLNAQYPGLSAWEKARKVCEMYEMDSTMLLTKTEIDKMVDLSEEGYSVVRQIVRENGQKEWLRIFDRQNLGEAETSVAFKRMVMELPKIGFVTGHRERKMYGDVPQDFGFVMSNKWNQTALCNQGFDVVEITLHEPIPEDINILWFADMRFELTPEEDAVLEEYIERGDNLVFMGEPRHRNAQNPLLKKYFGLELTPLVVGQDVRTKGKLLPNVLASRVTRGASEIAYQLGSVGILANENCSGVEQIEDKGYQVQVLAKCDTMGQFWTELETTDFLDDTVKFNPAVGEVSKAFNTVVGLTRMKGDKEQRVMVFGDVDCFSNSEFMQVRGVGAGNSHMVLGTGNWMSDGKAPLDVRRPGPTDDRVYMSAAGYGIFKWSLMFGLPFVLLGAGLYIWIRRRGR